MRTSACARAHTRSQLCARTHAHTCACAHTHTHAHTSTCTHTHVHTHIHTHGAHSTAWSIPVQKMLTALGPRGRDVRVTTYEYRSVPYSVLAEKKKWETLGATEDCMIHLLWRPSAAVKKSIIQKLSLFPPLHPLVALHVRVGWNSWAETYILSQVSRPKEWGVVIKHITSSDLTIGEYIKPYVEKK